MMLRYGALVISGSAALVLALAFGTVRWITTNAPANEPVSSNYMWSMVFIAVAVPLLIVDVIAILKYLMVAGEMSCQHDDFIKQHAGREWTRQEGLAIGPDGNLAGESVQRTDPLGQAPGIEWLPNGQYFRTRNQMAAFLVPAVAISAASIMSIVALPNLSDACIGGAIVGLLLGGASTFSLVINWYLILGRTPSHFAIGAQGIRIRYLGNRAPRWLLRSIRWDDIQDIHHVDKIMTGGANALAEMSIKVNGRFWSIQMDYPAQRTVLKEWCRRNPESKAAQKYAKFATTP